MENQLEVLVKNSQLEKTKAQFLLDRFSHYFKMAAEWEVKARAINVTDESQKAEMKMARVGRLFLREERLNVEKSRKELKAEALREGKAIDGIANVLKALIEPLEEHLINQERFVEIRKEREETVKRIEMERRMAEEERIAQQEKEAEQERIRLDNIRLHKEAQERGKAIIAEQKKQEDLRLAEKLKRDREFADMMEKEGEKLKAERKKQDDLLTKARMEKQKAKVEMEEKLRKEKEKKITCPKCGHKFTKE